MFGFQHHGASFLYLVAMLSARLKLLYTGHNLPLCVTWHCLRILVAVRSAAGPCSNLP